MAVHRNPSRTPSRTTLRHLWLAGLGVVAVSRRELLAVPGRFAAHAGGWQAQARRLAEAARIRLRDEVQPRVAGMGDEVEARLAPVLEKLGLATPRRASRKAARKPRRPQGRHGPAKAARRAPRRR